MTTLTKDQLRAFGHYAAETWYRDAACNLHQSFAAYYDAMGADPRRLVGLVRRVTDWAGTAYGIKGKADVLRLCIVAAALGHGYRQDPRFRAWVAATLGNAELPVTRRAEPMVRVTRHWLGKLWEDDGLEQFGARLAEHVRHGDDADLVTLHHILAGHWRLLDAADNQRLIDGLRLRASRQARSQTPARRLTYVACALVHGPDWLDDPQLPRLQSALSEQTKPAALADAITALYKEASA